MMQCPICGNELKQASRCDVCGKDIPHARNGLEVEYKEFPVSELLEIRHRPQADHAQTHIDSPQDMARSGIGRGAGKHPHKWKKAVLNGALFLLVVLMVIIAVLLLRDSAP